MCTVGDVLCACFCLRLQQRRNAFHCCAAGGHIAVAHFLAPKMEDHLFAVDGIGYTALHWATQESQLSMVEYLVKSCGFDLKARDEVGLLCFLVHFLSPSTVLLHAT